MQGGIKTAVLIAAVTALVVPAAATATYPGSNGRIFFDVGGGSGAAIFSIDPDGSGRERVVDRGREPAVSADGKRIAYLKGGDLYTANRSGGDEVQVTDTPQPERHPSFSPSGNKLLYATDFYQGDPGHIFTIGVDGGDRTRLTQSERPDSVPTYSPGGNKIAFVRVGSDGVAQVWKMDADGSNREQVTSGEFTCDNPSWSPDGNAIAFEGLDGPTTSIFAVNPNGTNLERLTFAGLGDHEPSYSPSGNKVVFRGERDDEKGLIIVGAHGGPVEQITERTPNPGVGVDADPYWGPTP